MRGQGTSLAARAMAACLVVGTLGVLAPSGIAAATSQTPIDVPSPTVDSGGAPLGAVRTMAGNYAPANSVPATGQTLPAATYPNGPAVFGSTFGGDGSTTFGVPDLQGRTPIGAGTGPGLSTVARGDKIGADNVTITRDQMPV